MRRLWLFVRAVVCVSLIAIAFAGTKAIPKEAASSRLQEQSGFDRLNGLWRSRGYGWIVSIKNGSARFYHEGIHFCIVAPDKTMGLAESGSSFALSSNGRLAHLSLGDETYRYIFDRISKLPDRCSRNPDRDPHAILNALDEIFKTHYPFFHRRDVAWSRHVEQARRRIDSDTSEKELFVVLSDLLSATGDAHVGLEAEIAGRNRYFAAGDSKVQTVLAKLAIRQATNVDDMYYQWEDHVWNKLVGQALLSGKGKHAGNGRIKYGLIGNRIGYLGLRAMDGFSDVDSEAADLAAVERALDDALTLFQGTKGVILDVSINQGGYDKVARAVARRFTDRPRIGYSKFAADAKGQRPQIIMIQPRGRPRFTGPVYLVTSNVTLSAAEVLVLAMRAFPNVTHIGETTRGSLSDVLWKRLPNGWILSLSNEAYLDHQGRLWEGKGIPPAVEFEVFSEVNIFEDNVGSMGNIVSMIHSSRGQPVSADSTGDAGQ